MCVRGFQAQVTSESVPSPHFASVLLYPLRVDYLKLPRPEDDTRGRMVRVQHHESLLQANKSQMRWLHTLDEGSGVWSTVELNP